MMRLPIPHRTARLALVAAAILLGGCAYKNPLIDDNSANRVNNASVAAANAPSTASDPSPATVSPAVPAKGPAASGSTPTPPSVASSAAAPAQNTASQKPAPQNAATNSSLTTTREQRRFGGLLTPYRIDIQQGNFVSEEMVSQLKPGMTPEQVRFVLGTPLLNDIFHADRWDYAFDLKRGNGETTRGRLTVFFKDKRLDHWEGGDLPNEQDYLAKISSARSDKKPVNAAPAPAAAPSTAKEPK